MKEEEIDLGVILRCLRNLSAVDLRVLQRQLTDAMYVKAVEDYMQAVQMKPLVEDMLKRHPKA